MMRLEIFDRRPELFHMLGEAEEMERFRHRFSGVARVQKKPPWPAGRHAPDLTITPSVVYITVINR